MFYYKKQYIFQKFLDRNDEYISLYLFKRSYSIKVLADNQKRIFHIKALKDLLFVTNKVTQYFSC